MALSVADSRTIFTSNDTGSASNWDEGTTSDYLTADFGGREGTGFVGYDVDIETLHNFDTVTSIPADMSGNHYGGWLRITNAGSVDTKANGGVRLCLRDSSNNESYWYVGGSDTYSGGWAYFVVDLDSTPDANNGTAATVTSAADLGVGFKMLAKSGDDNCQMDLMHYGTSGLVVTGTPDTGTYGTDNAMQELYDIIDAGNYGLMAIQAGSFVGKGSIQFNDDATGTCTFEDAGSTFVWANLPVSSSFYNFSLGSSSGVTAIRFGTVVGTGDDRQGVNGGSFLTAGPTWSIDFATNLDGNVSNDIKLYGTNLAGAGAGIKVDDGNKTSIVSAGIVNCGEVDPGTTNNGAEILNFAIIDPLGDANNYGMLFAQADHNIKQGSFITSGTPATQYMWGFTSSTDYSIAMTDMQFFGSFTSGTLWHGLNTGTNADVIVNATGTTNADQTEFSNTAGGTVTVSASVPLTITVLDENGDPIQDAQTSVYLKDPPFAEIMNEDTTILGIADATYGGTTPVDVVVKSRKSDDLDDPRYFPESSVESLTSDGLTLTVTLEVNPFL